MSPAWIVPDWPAPAGVHAASTLRIGGVSPPPWQALNLATHVGDEEARVAENRHLLALALGLPAEPAWLEQVHGTATLQLDAEALPASRVADAAVTSRSGRVLAVLTADCLPVLLCREDGTRIGVAHAGWRGLADGVLEAACAAMDTPPGALLAWIGPGISAAAYEVGAEVFAACQAGDSGADACFTPTRPGHWRCDLPGLARRRLEALGVSGVYGGHWCTHDDGGRFFSHRRDGAQQPTGRMATVIWRG